MQILADAHGHVYAIGERDCSLQRRHQKMIEEAPAPFLQQANPRQHHARRPRRRAQAAGYPSAGTLEFLLDAGWPLLLHGDEHAYPGRAPDHRDGVPEIDLVTWQLRIAMPANNSGSSSATSRPVATPSSAGSRPRTRRRDFAPERRHGLTFIAPGGPGVRVDSHLFPGYHVPPYYDSLLAKIAVWGKDRNEAIERMERALRETIIDGVINVTPLHRMIMMDELYRKGEIHTGYVGEFLSRSHHLVAGAQQDAIGP